MDFKDLVQQRRSHRKFAAELINSEHIQTILRAGLMAPTSKSTRAWHFYLTDDALDLERLSDAKALGGAFIKEAPLAIVVTADETLDDCWIEDCAIAAISMQYQAEELGLGSCWSQIRGRGLSDGTAAEDIVRGIMDIPESHRVLCVIALGIATDSRQPQNEDKLKWENVHIK